MKQKIKYQYTYLIYPFFTKKDKYKKNIQKLLKNSKCKLKLFQKDDDIRMYNYFLPKVREFFFETGNINENTIKEFERLDKDIQSAILARNFITRFKYCYEYENKKTELNKIAFDISNIEIIYTKKGIGFIIIKTQLINTDKLTDVIKFNNINFSKIAEKNKMFDIESIQNLKNIIKDITSTINEKNIDIINNDKIYNYSYICLDKENCNENQQIQNVFDDIVKEKKNIEKYDESNFVKYAFSENEIILFTTSINTDNYTKISVSFEKELLYSYIYSLYKKYELDRLNANIKIKKDHNKIRKEVFNFNNEIWINEITQDKKERILIEKINKVLEIDKKYLNLKKEFEEISIKKQRKNTIFKKIINSNTSRLKIFFNK